MYSKFSERATKVMTLAIHEARQSRHKYIVAKHILIGLLKERSSTGCKVLRNLDVDIESMLLEIQKLIKGDPENIDISEPPRPSVIEHAIEEAKALGHKYVGTEHILLGLLRQGEGVTTKVLTGVDLKYEDVRREIMNILKMEADEGKDM